MVHFGVGSCNAESKIYGDANPTYCVPGLGDLECAMRCRPVSLESSRQYGPAYARVYGLISRLHSLGIRLDNGWGWSIYSLILRSYTLGIRLDNGWGGASTVSFPGPIPCTKEVQHYL